MMCLFRWLRYIMSKLETSLLLMVWTKDILHIIDVFLTDSKGFVPAIIRHIGLMDKWYFSYFEMNTHKPHILHDWIPSFVITLEIRSSSQGLTVPDASVVRVTSTSDVIDLMNLGQRNRAVGATALNDRSSRSHRCCTLFFFVLHFLFEVLKFCYW